MVKRSITGWVPEDEKENHTLSHAGLDKDGLVDMIEGVVFKTKKEAVAWGNNEVPAIVKMKKVRVTITVDVEKM